MDDYSGVAMDNLSSRGGDEFASQAAGPSSPSSWSDAVAAAKQAPEFPEASGGMDTAEASGVDPMTPGAPLPVDYTAGPEATAPERPAGAGATPSADSVNAVGLIAGVTNPATGEADTATLARQIADAAAQDPAKAGAAYQAVREQLRQRDPSLSQQLDSDVARAVSDVAKGVAPGLNKAGAHVLTSNPILSKQWVSTQSAWTGKGGFTQGVRDLLDSHGIAVERGVRPAPPGSLGPFSGVPQVRANNINGLLAEKRIADGYRSQGLEVRPQQPIQNGSRVVDVRVEQLAPDPRNNRTLDIESKVGRTSLDPDIRTQVAKDAQALAENGQARTLGGALETAGKVLRPVAVVADTVQLGQAFHQDGNKVGLNTGRAASGIAGGWGGAIAGAEGGGALGAAVGSVVPVVGTAVGGVAGAVAGGIGGAIGGDWAGRRLFDAIRSRF